jgi:hypothetical protein
LFLVFLTLFWRAIGPLHGSYVHSVIQNVDIQTAMLSVFFKHSMPDSKR